MELIPSTFMFNDGDRIHSGYISQDIEDSMNSLNMDATEFAGFCKDIIYEYTEFDDEGAPIESSKRIVYDDEGNIKYDYSLRYSEFIALNTHMIQKLYKENETLKQRIEILEKAMS